MPEENIEEQETEEYDPEEIYIPDEDETPYIVEYQAKKYAIDAVEEIRYTQKGQEFYNVDEYGNPLET